MSTKTFRFKGKVSQSLLESKALNDLEFYCFLSFVISRFKSDLYFEAGWHKVGDPGIRDPR